MKLANLDYGNATNVQDGIINYLSTQDAVTSYDFPIEQLAGLGIGLFKSLVFWLLAIVLIIVFRIIFGIIFAIVFRKAKKKTAIRTLGLFGAAKGFIIGLLLVFPLTILSPAAGMLSEVAPMFMGGGNKGGSENVSLQLSEEQSIGLKDLKPEDLKAIVNIVSDQLSGSKACTYTNKFIETVKPTFSTYDLTLTNAEGEDETVKYVFATELRTFTEGVKEAVKLAKMFLNSDFDNPLEALNSMSEDEIMAMFEAMDENDILHDMVGTVVNEFLPEGVTLPEDFSLADEAGLFINVMKVMETDEEGNVTGLSLENIDADDLADALSSSNIICAFGESAEGALSELPEESIQDIESALNEKVGDESLSEEKKELIMKLFEDRQSHNPQPQPEPEPEPGKE